MSEPVAWLHHFGCLARDIGLAARSYEPLLRPAIAAPPIRISSQKVEVSFMPLGGGIFLELVQPEAENRFLNRMLKKGVSFYHLGFLCRDLKASEAGLEQAGARLLTRFDSEAFDGRECAFLLTANEQMVELIQAP